MAYTWQRLVWRKFRYRYLIEFFLSLTFIFPVICLLCRQSRLSNWAESASINKWLQPTAHWQCVSVMINRNVGWSACDDINIWISGNPHWSNELPSRSSRPRWNYGWNEIHSEGNGKRNHKSLYGILRECSMLLKLTLQFVRTLICKPSFPDVRKIEIIVIRLPNYSVFDYHIPRT